jgi:hypothetical protein
LDIVDGKLLRCNSLDYGYEIDASGNLVYSFTYDLQRDILIKTISNHNSQIYSSATFPNIAISDVSGTTLTMDNSTNLVHQYALMADLSGNYHTTFIIDQSGNEIDVDFIDSFTYDSNKSYIIIREPKTIIKHIGYTRFRAKDVFNYWENYAASLTSITTLVTQYTDEYFRGKRISLNSYFDTLIRAASPEIKGFDDIDFTYDNMVKYRRDLYAEIRDVIVTLGRDETPVCSWIDYLGHYICDTASLIIDGKTIEEIDDNIINIYNHRTTDVTNLPSLYRMICHPPNNGNRLMREIVYCPLPMCIAHESAALPIVALSNSDLRMELKFKTMEQLVRKPPKTQLTVTGKFKAHLSLSYVFLDMQLRGKFARSRHEYIFNVKRAHKYQSGLGKIRLDFHNPCRELLWMFQRDVDKQNKNYWNFTGQNKKIYDIDNFYNNIIESGDSLYDTIHHMLRMRGVTGTKLILPALDKDQVLRVKQLMKNEAPINPFTLSTLYLDGHKRFSIDSKQSSIIPFTDESCIDGVNAFKFSLYPNAYQPSGHINMNKFINIEFEYVLNTGANGTIYIITASHSLFRIASGFGMVIW